MALNIKDAETDRLARELAGLTGQPITAAVREALEEKLAVVHARRRSLARDDVLREIVARGRARVTVDSRSADEILGYDDQGLPEVIVVDSSVLVAVVLGEDDAEQHVAVLEREQVAVSAVSLVESGIVVRVRQGPDAARDLDLLVEAVVHRVIPVDAEQARVAVDAWERFGKGRHPAGLNLGDCFSYAAARSTGAPLLFKGDDFSRTDLVAAR